MYSSLILKKEKIIRNRVYKKYIYALLATLACLLIQLWMKPTFGPVQYFLLFPLVFTVVALGGIGPALLVIIVGGLGANRLLVDPLMIDASRSADSMVSFSKFLIFAFSTMGASWFVHLIQNRQAKLEKDLDLLKESDRQFKILADTSPVLIWMTNSEKVTTWFNKNWREFTGNDLDKSLSIDTADLLFLDDRARVLDAFHKAFDSRSEFKEEYRLKTKNGDFKWILCNAVPMYNNDEFCGYVGVCVDINDQKLSEEKIKRAVMSRDHFLSVASHELKTPISSLVLQAQIFRKMIEKGDSVSKERIVKMTDQVSRQVFRLDRLIDDMLDNSRINSGKFTITPEEFNLCEVTQDTVERVKEQFSSIRAGTPIITYCRNDENSSEYDGTWDKLKIEQVITNLLTNAIKYGEHGPIEVKLTAGKDKILIEVKDQGLGIESEHIDKIFNRFYRIHGPSDSGLGLGLFISKQIVKAHNGKIWVESEKGKGSTFKVELPKHAMEKSEDFYE